MKRVLFISIFGVYISCFISRANDFEGLSGIDSQFMEISSQLAHLNKSNNLSVEQNAINSLNVESDSYLKKARIYGVCGLATLGVGIPVTLVGVALL
ncbi:MAG: hypothetical protein K2G40_01340 [Muribaculaceae bacterium]|nr:hypothetical protein [Muribaculaceae bacterium]